MLRNLSCWYLKVSWTSEMLELEIDTMSGGRGHRALGPRSSKNSPIYSQNLPIFTLKLGVLGSEWMTHCISKPLIPKWSIVPIFIRNASTFPHSALGSSHPPTKSSLKGLHCLSHDSVFIYITVGGWLMLKPKVMQGIFCRDALRICHRVTSVTEILTTPEMRLLVNIRQGTSDVLPCYNWLLSHLILFHLNSIDSAFPWPTFWAHTPHVVLSFCKNVKNGCKQIDKLMFSYFISFWIVKAFSLYSIELMDWEEILVALCRRHLLVRAREIIWTIGLPPSFHYRWNSC